MNEITLLIPAKMEKESLPTVLDEIKKYNLNAKIILNENDTQTINSIKDSDYEIIYQPLSMVHEPWYKKI